MIRMTYDDPDTRHQSDHDPGREVRSRWVEDAGLEIVVDLTDGRIVTVWRRGWKP